MKAQEAIASLNAFENPRLCELELELGITGFQKPLWDAFIEALEQLSNNLAVADMERVSSSSEGPPSMSTQLRALQRRLAIERKGISELIEITDLLFQSLTTRQRMRADLLLPPLCRYSLVRQFPLHARTPSESGHASVTLFASPIV